MNMGIEGIQRIEEFTKVENKDAKIDPMLQQMYESVDQTTFDIPQKAEEVRYIDNINEYNFTDVLI